MDISVYKLFFPLWTFGSDEQYPRGKKAADGASPRASVQTLRKRLKNHIKCYLNTKNNSGSTGWVVHATTRGGTAHDN
ncbi:hypothetical protein [Pseudomonas sp. PWP3-1b2]|uniref:hypothetical protein n=1 Tax=Pseudomonas sp. PWP3-1b2 TaxID=2804656 RepID=UPI003CF8C158